MKLTDVEINVLKRVFEEKTPWELISELEIDFGNFVKVVNRLYERKLIKVKDGKIKISELGKRFVEREREIDSKRILKILKKVVKKLPEPKDEFDQGTQRIEDYLKRALFLHKFNDLSKRIAILGDDLQGITFGLTGIPRKVVVFEIDRELVDFINEVSKKYKLNVRAIEYDARDRIPPKFKNKFQTFVCDLLETKIGLKLFLSRGSELLESVGNTLYLTLSHCEASLEKWYFAQKILTRMNFVITDLIRDFSAYPENFNKSFECYKELPKEKKFLFEVKRPRKTWYKASLIRCVSIAKPKPIIKGSISCKNIYDDKESF